ncbi:maltose acetyltransferase domain-containing protein [Formosa sp. 3Alg 14/1]|uniref:maltose acetyltransferase domain-containing protein n=1 Tax=Formosa sp. 3Alg 14/1 TaxID=3382190 RepID=UPI0039BE80D8
MNNAKGKLYCPANPILSQERLRARLLFQIANNLSEEFKDEGDFKDNNLMPARIYV